MTLNYRLYTWAEIIQPSLQRALTASLEVKVFDSLESSPVPTVEPAGLDNIEGSRDHLAVLLCKDQHDVTLESLRQFLEERRVQIQPCIYHLGRRDTERGEERQEGGRGERLMYWLYAEGGVFFCPNDTNGISGGWVYKHVIPSREEEIPTTLWHQIIALAVAKRKRLWQANIDYTFAAQYSSEHQPVASINSMKYCCFNTRDWNANLLTLLYTSSCCKALIFSTASPNRNWNPRWHRW